MSHRTNEPLLVLVVNGDIRYASVSALDARAYVTELQ